MDINDVLKEFKATQSGDYYILYCPQCGRKEAYCYIEDINHWLEDSSYRIPICIFFKQMWGNILSE